MLAPNERLSHRLPPGRVVWGERVPRSVSGGMDAARGRSTCQYDLWAPHLMGLADLTSHPFHPFNQTSK
jgi:hypothetical protein